ncbi:MAG: virulence RhuM family protein, partial [bacterium]|nr:virulence RhuM family protein [bacterium]
TRFRIWATQRLKEYIVKGFIMDDERLKEPQGGRYFEELLARIRDIRSSEKVFWRKILDIYATSIDYDPKSDASIMFFKQVQNKMHWAAHGHTAAELIYARSNADRRNMGITNYPGDRLLKRDVEIAKNYLTEDELNVLNRIVAAYLEVAELQALNRIPMTMQDWIERLHQFLTMTGRELLKHAGETSHEAAIQKAHAEYEKYRLKMLEEPTEVEKHFVEAEKELKQIESTKNRRGKHGKA